jgi:hypothetical protein
MDEEQRDANEHNWEDNKDDKLAEIEANRTDPIHDALSLGLSGDILEPELIRL